MSILIYRDRATACAAAATLMAAAVIENPRCVLGLDWARELSPVYRTLARMSSDGLLDWSDVRTFNLYEQVRSDSDGSMNAQLTGMLLDPAGVPAEPVSLEDLFVVMVKGEERA